MSATLKELDTEVARSYADRAVKLPKDATMYDPERSDVVPWSLKAIRASYPEWAIPESSVSAELPTVIPESPLGTPAESTVRGDEEIIIVDLEKEHDDVQKEVEIPPSYGSPTFQLVDPNKGVTSDISDLDSESSAVEADMARLATETIRKQLANMENPME